MTVSKINREDAQEWLESLQQVGEGWYRQVALAVRANAHKALGMERREFAQTIGQKMIDPRQAVIELHNEGHSINAIADILGVSKDRTVGRILAEEGLIEWSPTRARMALESGYDAPTGLAESGSEVVIEHAESDSEANELRAKLDALDVKMKGEVAKREKTLKDLREHLHKTQESLSELHRKQHDQEQGEESDADINRRRKEAEAFAEEQGRKIRASLAHLAIQSVLGALEEATEHLRQIIPDGGVTPELVRQVENALDAFTEELNVARATVGIEV